MLAVYEKAEAEAEKYSSAGKNYATIISIFAIAATFRQLLRDFRRCFDAAAAAFRVIFFFAFFFILSLPPRAFRCCYAMPLLFSLMIC